MWTRLMARLEQQPPLGLVRHTTVPAIDAFDRADLRAGHQPAFDQRLRNALRIGLRAHRGDNGLEAHFCLGTRPIR